MGYQEKYADSIESQFCDLENRIIADIVRRIHKTGEITSTADWQVNKLWELGYSTAEIEQAIKKTLKATYPEMFELYDQVGMWEYVRDEGLYNQINEKFIPYDKNEKLQQLVESAKRQTEETMQNLTGTLGIVTRVDAQMTFLPLTDYYKKKMDEAVFSIASGGFDYQSTIKRIVGELAASGIRVIDYASGYTSRLPVAVRRAVMTGLSQMAGQVSQMNAEKLGTEYFEVDWHEGARPTHQVWQGKVYSMDELVSVCGLGTVTGLNGANCYHNYYPFIPGVSERNWSDEWLEEQNRIENTPKDWNGKGYTAYEARQKQRQMETSMRAQRQKIRDMELGGVDEMDITIAKARYQGQMAEYAEFSDAMGLKPHMERVYIDGLGRKAPSRNVARIYANEGKTAIIKRQGMNRKYDASAIEPMPKEQLDRIANSFERKGGIIQMSELTDRYLESRGAEAITYDSDTILLRRNPGRAAVFEELIHTAQIRKGKYDGTRKSELICEIEAQKKLLRYSKTYKLTEPEIKQTKRVLDEYEKKFAKINKEG